MKFRTTFLTAVALSLLATAPSFARTSLQDPATPTPTPAPQDQIAPATQTTLPPQSAQPQGAAPLRVMSTNLCSSIPPNALSASRSPTPLSPTPPSSLPRRSSSTAAPRRGFPAHLGRT